MDKKDAFLLTGAKGELTWLKIKMIHR